MSERIHDNEPDTGEHVVRALLAEQYQQCDGLPIEYLKTSGTDNAMWRILVADGPDLVMRLPRRPGSAAGVLAETETLRQLERMSIGWGLRTPKPRYLGQPSEVFPHHWSVLEWIEGSDAWTSRLELENLPTEQLTLDLADAVNTIGELTIDAPPRSLGSRGGPLLPVLKRMEGWLESKEWNAAQLLDVKAVRRLADQAREVLDEPVIEGFVHGDLIPTNLLVDRNRLTAIIDWGSGGWGDTSQDLAPAWTILTSPAERSAFNEAVGADEAAWIRGRALELEHAVGGILYYAPKAHPLGDLMARTLDRILKDAG